MIPKDLFTVSELKAFRIDDPGELAPTLSEQIECQNVVVDEAIRMRKIIDEQAREIQRLRFRG
jgi:hypothetical protein